MTVSLTTLFYYAECRTLFVVMLNVIMLNVIMLKVIMLMIKDVLTRQDLVSK